MVIAKRMRQLALAAVGVALFAALVGALTACGAFGAAHDASLGDDATGSAEIIHMPDGFRNAARKCDGPNMVYSLSYGKNDNYSSTSVSGALSVAPNDPRCVKAVASPSPSGSPN